MARHGGTIPGKNRAFTTLVDPISPPSTPPPKERRKMVEAPGTAPGSETLMPRGVYRHSRFPDLANIGASIGFLKAHASSTTAYNGDCGCTNFGLSCTVTCTRGIVMDVVTYSRARQDLARLMDKVSDDRSPLIVTRRGGRSVVVLSLDEYRGMEETLYLMRNPANARRLLKSIRAADRGELIERALVEPRVKPRRRSKR
jgi:antitoxin YefM